MAVHPNGQWIVVTESGADRVSVHNAVTLEAVASAAVADQPRGLAISLDGSRLVISHFLSGEITVVDFDTLRVVHQTTALQEANAATAVRLHPDGNRIFAPLQRARSSNASLQFDTTVAPRVAVVDIHTGLTLPRELIGIDAIDRPVNLPSAVDFGSGGSMLYIANAGSNDVTAIDLSTGLGAGNVVVRDRPIGVAVAPDGSTVYVHNSLSSDISVIDRAAMVEERRITVTATPLPEAVHRGKILFNTSAPEKLSTDRWISCASCHLDGVVDGRTWQFDQGPRNTTQIRGLAGTEPFHWSGERIDLLDFDQTVREVQFGAGLSPADIADLAAFLGHEPVPPSPSRLADGSLGPQAQLGQQVFAASGCGECHVGSSYTDHIRHDVGTGGRPGEALGPQFDTPTLLGLYDTPPYLHDGRAADLVALFADHNPGDRHGATGRLSTADLRDLEAFLVSLP